jgi:hypothetical protein
MKSILLSNCVKFKGVQRREVARIPASPNKFSSLPQFIVSNYNLKQFIDGKDNLFPSFFVPSCNFKTLSKPSILSNSVKLYSTYLEQRGNYVY